MARGSDSWKALFKLCVFLFFKKQFLKTGALTEEIISKTILQKDLEQPIGGENSQRIPGLQSNNESDATALQETGSPAPPLLNIKYAFRFPSIDPIDPMDPFEPLNISMDNGRLMFDSRPFSQRHAVEKGLPLYGPCGQRLNTLEGIIESPNYPYNYPPSSQCEYFIEVEDPTFLVSLNCLDFSIQSGNDNCEHDFLEIQFLPDNVTRYCGEGDFTAVGIGNVSLTFHSDQTFQYRGFMCRYEVLFANGSKINSSSFSGNQNVSEAEDGVCPSEEPYLGWSGKCGKITQSETSRIVGGVEVQPHEFPWMAAIIVQCRKEAGHYCQVCGGTVIHRDWILTAGSCVASFPIEKIGVLLGDHNLYVLSHSQKFFRTPEVFVHPEYNTPTPLNNNIALIKLPQSVQFSKFVSPICLPPSSIPEVLSMLATIDSARIVKQEFAFNSPEFKPELLQRETEEKISSSDMTRLSMKEILHEGLLNRTVSIYGWGKAEDVGPVDQVLREVEVEIIPNEVCNSYYGVMTDDMICTSGSEDKGPCKGDSGSPNQMKLKTGQWIQMGILSFGAGTGCEKGLPSGNVLLPVYMDWISFVTGVNFTELY